MHKRLQYNSPVILTFALASLVILIVNTLTNGLANQALFSVYHSSLTDPLTYVRMFCHVLGHANYSHYIGNMMLFLVVGPPLEEKYGSLKILVCILITALVSGLVQYFFFPQTALLGASGIVFMLILLSSLAGDGGQRHPLYRRRSRGRHYTAGQRIAAHPHYRRTVRRPARICHGKLISETAGPRICGPVFHTLPRADGQRPSPVPDCGRNC